MIKKFKAYIRLLRKECGALEAVIFLCFFSFLGGFGAIVFAFFFAFFAMIIVEKLLKKEILK